MTQMVIRDPQIIAAEINNIKEQTRRMVLSNSIEIGRRLTEAKLSVPHGEWGDWLKISVNYSHSTANNLMRIFEEFGANQLALFGDNAKSQTLGNLSYTQALALLGVPEEEREQFVQTHDIEQMSTRELQQAIKEKQELEAKLQKAEKAREKTAKQLEELDKRIVDSGTEVARLKTELAEAKIAGDEDKVWKLQEALEVSKNDLSEAQQKIKQLEADLKAKPIDVPAAVEVIPPEVEAELQELRKKAAVQGNQAAVKFKLQFDGLAAGFRDLLATLGELEDPELQSKFKTAVTGLIDKMRERL